MANLLADKSTPDFCLERHQAHGSSTAIQSNVTSRSPTSTASNSSSCLIRKEGYMGPVNGFFSIGAGGCCGANPFDLMELIRRTPHGSFFTYQTTFRLGRPDHSRLSCIALRHHTRSGHRGQPLDTDQMGVRDRRRYQPK